MFTHIYIYYIYATSDIYCVFTGESGLGKSTLINSMFLADIYSEDYPGPSHRVKKTVQVETSKVLLKEKGVNLILTIVDTPGFGDAVDNSNCWQPIIDYIESRCVYKFIYIIHIMSMYVHTLRFLLYPYINQIIYK